MPISPIWPAATAVDANGAIAFHGRTAESLLDEFGSPLYLIDTDEVSARAKHFVRAAAEAFNTSTTHVSFAGKAFLSKEIVRLVAEAGMFVDTCTMGEMRIALAAGVPGRRLVLHGNNKSDDEIALAIEQGFAKIVVDEPNEPERIAAIARKLGKRARVMLRVTVGVHAGGHEYISTAHEDQKFGVPLLAAGADAAVLDVLNNLTDVTPAATNARIAESDVNAGNDHPQSTAPIVPASGSCCARPCGPPTPTSCPKSISAVVTPWPTPTTKIPWTSMWSSLVWPSRSATPIVLWACPLRPSASSPAVTSWLQPA